MKKLSLLLPVVAGSMFGAAGIFVRGLRSFGIHNVSILFLRSVIASVVLFLFLLIYNKNLLKIAKKDIPIFFGTGILGMSGVTLFYNEAVSRLSLSLTAVLTSLSPVFVIILAFGNYRLCAFKRTFGTAKRHKLFRIGHCFRRCFGAFLCSLQHFFQSGNR